MHGSSKIWQERFSINLFDEEEDLSSSMRKSPLAIKDAPRQLKALDLDGSTFLGKLQSLSPSLFSTVCDTKLLVFE